MTHIRKACPSPYHDGILAQFRKGRDMHQLAAKYATDWRDIFDVCLWASNPQKFMPPLEILKWKVVAKSAD